MFLGELAEQKMMMMMMQLVGTGFGEYMALPLRLHLKGDIHYLPGIIGFLSAAALCASAE